MVIIVRLKNIVWFIISSSRSYWLWDQNQLWGHCVQFKKHPQTCEKLKLEHKRTAIEYISLQKKHTSVGVQKKLTDIICYYSLEKVRRAFANTLMDCFDRKRNNVKSFLWFYLNCLRLVDKSSCCPLLGRIRTQDYQYFSNSDEYRSNSETINKIFQ